MIFIKFLKEKIFAKTSLLNLLKILCTIFIGIIIIFLIFKCVNLTQTNRNLQSNIKEKEKIVQKIETENDEYVKKNDELIKKIEEKDSVIGGLEAKLKEVEKKLEELSSMEFMSIPVNGFKSYMDYRSISKGSKQGKIVYGDEAWTDGDGLRMWGEYYCVALGSYYGNVGDKFCVETDKGNKYTVIKADEKADIHTDASNRYTLSNGCMIEWLVEIDKLPPSIRQSGNINNIKKVEGIVTKIIKIEG